MTKLSKVKVTLRSIATLRSAIVPEAERRSNHILSSPAHTLEVLPRVTRAEDWGFIMSSAISKAFGFAALRPFVPHLTSATASIAAVWRPLVLDRRLRLLAPAAADVAASVGRQL